MAKYIPPTEYEHKVAGADIISLTFSRDAILIETILSQPDPDWTFTDDQGHDHYMRDGKYPTLHTEHLGDYWCDGCMEHHEDYGPWRCVVCGQEVTPGKRVPEPYWQAGMQELTVVLADDVGAEVEWQEPGGKRFRLVRGTVEVARDEPMRVTYHGVEMREVDGESTAGVEPGTRDGRESTWLR